MKSGRVIKAFPFAFDGINVSHLAIGAPFPSEGTKVADNTFDGLVTAGYVEEIAGGKIPAEEQLNRDIIDAYDRRLTGMSDADLKAVVARSGTPYSGNMIHATLVQMAKRQMLAELNGAAPILGIDPESGVTEQPRTAPGQATPPSAAAAVAKQQAQADAAGPAAGENKATNQFGDPVGNKPSGEIKFEEMTVAELKEYAEANNVDLGDATKKADILDAIQKAKKG